MSSGLFTIGADPEVALIDTMSGKLKSAIGLIRGTKHEPEFFDDGSNIQHDNVAAEFAIAPMKTQSEFVGAIRTSLAHILNALPTSIKITKCAAVDYPPEELDNEEARQFGCDPDFNAWNMGMPFMSDEEDNRAEGTLRSFGGHLHVGYVEGSGNDFLLDYSGKLLTIQVMDYIIGLKSLFLDKTEGADRRRQLYGKAGSFRPTDYGVEYRVLSNFWIFEESLIKMMYNFVDLSLRIVREGLSEELFSLVPKQSVSRVIDSGDVELAEKLTEKIETWCAKHFS